MRRLALLALAASLLVLGLLRLVTAAPPPPGSGPILAITTTPTSPRVNLPLIRDGRTPGPLPSATPSQTNTSTATSSATATSTATRTPTATPTATAPPEPLIGVVNGDFELGPSAGWSNGTGIIVSAAGAGVAAYRGSFLAVLPESNEANEIAQSVNVPASAPYLTYRARITSTESTCGVDIGGVGVTLGGEVVATDRLNLCTATASGEWVRRSVDLSAYAGQAVSIQILAGTFGATPNSTLYVDFVTFSAAP